MSPASDFLSVLAHRRDAADLRYVYPVLSRRARGVSIGVNLNINRACNWACTYCQVEGLRRGAPDPVEIPRLVKELRHFLRLAREPDYLARHVRDEALRRLADVAFSGDGEPTGAKEFPEIVEAVTALLREMELSEQLPIRLITNGSLIERRATQKGISRLAEAKGEVWFKVDRGSAAGMLAVNQTRSQPEIVLRRLLLCARLAPTWAETCWFAQNGRAPDAAEEEAYLALIARAAPFIRGIHLYGLARQPRPEALEGASAALSRLSPEKIQSWGETIAKRTGVRVEIFP
ncbi:MAG: radical SAM protein [Zoogloeaceae bacterium]|jgi:wyosine [tRNA(Phe)-imidazoG37] synthetase (radical SAM superfamily)|nr:radical SAM protein [Zoogloeaceae bacterium]